VTAETSRPKMSQRATASLIVLMASARELSNPELSELSGFVLDGSDRRQLNELGLVTSRRVGRPTRMCSRRRAGARRADCSGPSGRPRRVVRRGAVRVAGGGGRRPRPGRPHPGRVLRREPGRGRAPSARPEGAHEAEQARRRPSRKPTAPVEAVEADPRAVESAIREAYADLADRDGGWVGLAPLRARLGTYSRAEVDRALRSLVVQPDVHIIPVANLKSLTSADREAALRLGGEDNHAIAIEAR
jgi:hypothetical protein